MNKKTLGYILIVLSAVIFSTVELSLKAVSGIFAPMQITTIRFLGGGLFLIPFAVHALKKKGRRLKGNDLAFFLLVGLLFAVLGMFIHQLALQRAPASAVAVLFSCNALFATLLAGLLLKEPLGPNHFIALFFEVAAVVVIIRPWEQHLDPVGVLLALLSAFFYGLYVVVGKKRSAEMGGIVITCGGLLAGSLELTALILLGNIPAVSAFFRKVGLTPLADVPLIPQLTWAVVPALLAICVIVTGAGNVFHMIAVELTSAREAAVVFFLKPMLAPVFALIFLHEEIGLNMAVGIVLFLIGSAMALWGDGLFKKKAAA
nr:DMT family transporter [Lachnospiraceae bacterium]